MAIPLTATVLPMQKNVSDAVGKNVNNFQDEEMPKKR
jgi:hypothetical protein